MSQQPFKKFINPKNNAAVKEKHKQDKKNAKKEKALAIEKHFAEKRALRQQGFGTGISPEAAGPKKKEKRQKYPQKKENGMPATASPAITARETAGANEMPLNKYLAHCGVTSRRDAVA